MNEGSFLPSTPFKLRSSYGRAFKQKLARLFRKRRRKTESAPAASLSLQARAAIQEHAEAHATLFERAARLMERAERLESAGTPSESARNRAERAKEEVEQTLAALKSSFVGSGGREKRRAFDEEIERLYPAFKVYDEGR